MINRLLIHSLQFACSDFIWLSGYLSDLIRPGHETGLHQLPDWLFLHVRHHRFLYRPVAWK